MKFDETFYGGVRFMLGVIFSYGGGQGLVSAARKLAERAARGELKPEEIDEKAISDALYVPELPDVDLMIRTGGERRTSNFLPWQSVYAELYFSEKLWPDFTTGEMRQALEYYAKRDRRFGALNDDSTGDGQ